MEDFNEALFSLANLQKPLGFIAVSRSRCYAPSFKHPRLGFSVGTGSNASDTLAKTPTADFRPFGNQLIDKTVDYHT